MVNQTPVADSRSELEPKAFRAPRGSTRKWIPAEAIQMIATGKHRHTHTPVWGPDINVPVQMKWKTRLERLPCWNRPKQGWRPTLAVLVLQASCTPAGCLLRGFVCLITSKWWTQSRAVPVSVPSLQPPISVLTSSPGHGAGSKGTPCVLDVREPVRLWSAGQETFEYSSS